MEIKDCGDLRGGAWGWSLRWRSLGMCGWLSVTAIFQPTGEKLKAFAAVYHLR